MVACLRPAVALAAAVLASAASAAPADAPLPPPAMIELAPVEAPALAIATRALRALQVGAATGDYGDLVDLLADDVTFYAPVPGFAGLIRGKARARELFAKMGESLRATLTLGRTLANGSEIAFELRAEGAVEGFNADYANNLAITFVIADGKVVQFREYEAAIGGWAGAATGRGAFRTADEASQ